MKKILFLFVLMITINLHSQQTNSSVLGRTDFNVLLKSVPTLQGTPEAAFQYVCNKSINCQGSSQLEVEYKDFKKKMDIYSNQLASSLNAKSQDYYNKKGQQGMYNDSKRQVNSNDLINQMGGVDKISQMSESERELAAKKAIAKNSSKSSSFSPFSEAEMERMMNDPEYAKQMAAKYNNMTEKQKEEMVKNQLKTKKIESTNEDHENALNKSNEAKNTMNINLFVAKSTKQLGDALENYRLKIEQTRSSIGNHNDLHIDYQREYEKIPLVIMGEGKMPDPKMVRELNIKYALKHKRRAAIELTQVQIEHKKLISAINKVIADYNSFLDANKYRVNGKFNSVYNGTNTEMSLAQLEMSIGEAIGKLAEISYNEDSTASGYEQDYQRVLTEK